MITMLQELSRPSLINDTLCKECSMVKTHHSNTIKIPVTCSKSEEVKEDARERANQFEE